ncbi:MAG TPA: transcription-repair coupling factor [Bacteroidales bacterium]|nr:transcription-repair coupling factor [Bacteroidales bacterium]
MDSKDLGRLYLNHPEFELLCTQLNKQEPTCSTVEGLSGSSKSMVIAAAFCKLQTTHLVVAEEKEDAAYLFNDLVSLAGDDSVYFFPSTYKRSIQYGQTEASNLVLRTEAMNFLASGKRKCIVVTYPESLMEKVISKKSLKKNTLKVKEGDALSMEFMNEILDEYNFQRMDFVYEPGQYSIRGSLIDIFSYSSDVPYRIDFFGEEIESIRSFNTDDQLSIKRLSEISIIPNVQDMTIAETAETLPEFFPPSSVIWSEDLSYISSKINSIYESAWTDSNAQPVNEKNKMAISGSHFQKEIARFRLVQLSPSALFDPSYTAIFNTEPQPVFNKNFELLGEKLVNNTQTGIKNILVSESETQIKRLKDIFTEVRPDVIFEPVLINIHRGFTDKDLKISLYTDHQIFDRHHKFRIRGAFTRKESIIIKELTGLNPGDFVVHIDHGIGRFGGLEKIDINGKLQEAIKLVYKNNDTLFVGIHALHRISKYKGKDSTEPRIYKLGSGAWQKLKNSTKRKVKDIARDLIMLYAKRMTVEGFSFSPDSYLQRELEASFIYEDTPDQLAASNAVKEDMEKRHPMDRLICGDVGFGKTEVAIRAAFKAAADNKQTAILVPTTILALQHFQTFNDRLKDFPVNIEYVSRHRKPADQRRIFEKLANGEIEIIIGTHKLVSKEMKFKDLGLLIIDEEQRFGVSLKERLKKLKTSVDTLTLTATPIPRTLQFSLMGARDLSIINTAPPNRMPIITELHGFNEEIIKEGIEYETSRNGQVFFIHNRIETIKEIETVINRINPGIKCAIVHGQMEGRLIENSMFDFVHGDYDVLIATTIIESGLDIPNANTIFINNAHQFGLSELHQLRGRVGRSNKKAFCYLLTPPLNVVTHEARRRLKAIEEFSDLGSGFNIAMQDLDIRGAGNLLGGEQSGFIADIGFEAYQRILQEAVQELKTEEFRALLNEKEEGGARVDTRKESYVGDCQIETDLEIMFPDDYVSNISERIRLYKELNEIVSNDGLKIFESKLVDRFGPLPPPAVELFSVVKLREIAIKLAIEKVILKKKMLICQFVTDPDSAFYSSRLFISLVNYVNKHSSRISVRYTETRLSIKVKEVINIRSATELLQGILEYHFSFA